MRRVMFALVSTLIGLALPAVAEDQIRYFSCRADNDSEASVVGLNEATQKVCDRSIEVTWFSPAEFDAAKVAWNDGLSTKAIYRKGRKHYEHNLLLLVHIGHCDKTQPTNAQKCSPP
jgi:hypothetical protein